MYARARAHAHTRTRTRARAHAHVHPRTHTRAHARAHTRIRQAIWRQAFGFVNPALTAWDVKNKYGNKRVCFRKVRVSKEP